MGSLAQLVAEYDADPEVTGVVVTQGTDTLEETVYFVDCCYDGEMPVVFTGAMRNPSLAGADEPANLLVAVRTATSDGARLKTGWTPHSTDPRNNGCGVAASAQFGSSF